MKIKCRTYLAALAIASLGMVCAQANTITGSVYENQIAGAADATPANVPAGVPDVTFSTVDPLQFTTGDYTIGGFLSTGNGATILTGASQLGNTLDN